MNARRYIGGAFAAEDSKRFYAPAGDWERYFPFSIGALQRFDFETGTDALAACLKQLKLKGDYPLFVPLHYCGETLSRLKVKCPHITIHRYAHLSDIPESPACILWNHFNGYATPPQTLFDCRHWLVIEDYVQAAFSLQQVKGSAAFTSLRKWAELDVAFLYMASLDISTDQSESEYFKAKKQAEKTKAIWKSAGDNATEQQFLQEFQQAEQALPTAALYQANRPELEKLKAIAWSNIIAQRQENAEVLLAGLSTLPLTVLENHALFCMLQVDNRDAIRQALAAKGIFSPVHWLDSSDAHLSRTLLSLPIDQRYTREDMQRILMILNNAINHKTF
jgi:hypothetical protein